MPIMPPLPTDGLVKFHDAMKETEAFGLERVRDAQAELGTKVRALLASKGFKSVAAEGFEAPGVVVCYTDDGEVQNGKKFAAQGVQIAAGVPLQCDEPADFKTFRLGPLRARQIGRRGRGRRPAGKGAGAGA